jgi:hypothetical protein
MQPRINMGLKKEDNIITFDQNLGKILNDKKIKFALIQDGISLNLKDIRIGLILGFSCQNPVSFIIGKKIIEELTNFLSKTEIKIYFIDCDLVSKKFKKEVFNSYKLSYFESAWIEHGEITKSYKYQSDLTLFFSFLKNRFLEIEISIKNSFYKAYLIDPLKKNLGIKNETFDSKNETVVLARSKYKGEFLFDLMKYQKNGHYYEYEDDNLVIYEPTTPSFLSSCFLRKK